MHAYRAIYVHKNWSRSDESNSFKLTLTKYRHEARLYSKLNCTLSMEKENAMDTCLHAQNSYYGHESYREHWTNVSCVHKQCVRILKYCSYKFILHDICQCHVQ